jgi:hypothetical protein
MLAAIAAAGTSLGQCQLSQIDEREAALGAWEQVLAAKEQESQVEEQNTQLLTLARQQDNSQVVARLEDTVRQQSQSLATAVGPSSGEAKARRSGISSGR